MIGKLSNWTARKRAQAKVSSRCAADGQIEESILSLGDRLRTSGPANECRLPAKAKVGLREFVGFLGGLAKGMYVSKRASQLSLKQTAKN